MEEEEKEARDSTKQMVELELENRLDSEGLGRKDHQELVLKNLETERATLVSSPSALVLMVAACFRSKSKEKEATITQETKVV
jgi:hypothetical protein